MAFQKDFTLPSGIVGNYWKIEQKNDNVIRDDCVVTLLLYVSQAGRELGNTPLPHSVQLNFAPNDHPYRDLDLDDAFNQIDMRTDTYDPVQLETALRYVQIKEVAAHAQERLNTETDPDTGDPITEEDLTPNEKKALFFIDALDV
jgi:hypothetical protein